MDRLTAIEAFIAVAEAGSFTRAAVRMRLSTPMMSLHIGRLEAYLGVRLFHRTTRRVDLTEDGRQFLAHARAALDAVETAERAFRPGRGLTGRVSVDVPASIGHRFVVPALAAFHARHPNILLDLSFGDRGTFFRVDGFDIVMRTGQAPLAGWQTVPLGSTRLICLASPAYLETSGTPQRPEHVSDHRCILYSSVQAPGGMPWTFVDEGRILRVRAPASFTFNDGAAIMAAARAGLGIAQNLEMLTRADIESGTLVSVLPDINMFEVPVVLMGAKDRLILPHVRAVLDFLSDDIAWGLGTY